MASKIKDFAMPSFHKHSPRAATAFAAALCFAVLTTSVARAATPEDLEAHVNALAAQVSALQAEISELRAQKTQGAPLAAATPAAAAGASAAALRGGIRRAVVRLWRAQLLAPDR
jgi:hypothetical protein